MKIISWNVNGIRAIYKKDFVNWFQKTDADIICLQETKAQKDQVPTEILTLNGYINYFNDAQKKGYSGVAVYSKQKPNKVENLIGHTRFDSEGRMLKLTYDNFILFNFYMPNGGRDKENLEYKLDFYNHLLKYLKTIQAKNTILTGDFNIAHKEVDLAHPKENQDSIMFTPKEREQIDKLIKLGFSDTFRLFNKQPEQYTWWAYWRNMRERNLGWRIDYTFVSKSLKSKVKDAFIQKEAMGSDHCPVGINLNT